MAVKRGDGLLYRQKRSYFIYIFTAALMGGSLVMRERSFRRTTTGLVGPGSPLVLLCRCTMWIFAATRMATWLEREERFFALRMAGQIGKRSARTFTTRLCESI